MFTVMHQPQGAFEGVVDMPLPKSFGGVPLGIGGLLDAPGGKLFIVVTNFQGVLIKLNCPPYARQWSFRRAGSGGA